MNADKKKGPERKGPEKKGLGRGLAALLGDEGVAAIREDVAPVPAPKPDGKGTPSADIGATAAGGGAQRLPIAAIRPNPNQPRRDFDETALSELAASIARHGLVQPILVRPIPNPPADGPRYEIVAGERRWRAAQRAQLHDVPVLVRAVADTDILAIALIENIQRQDLNPVEEALGYRRLMDEFGHTQDAVAELVGKSRPAVANALRLLALPDLLLTRLRDGRLSAGHGRALLTLPPHLARALTDEITEKHLSVRETEARAKAMLAPPNKPTDAKGGKRGNDGKIGAIKSGLKDADTRAFERALAHALGLEVEIMADARDAESGALIIRYTSLDQLDDLAKRLKGSAG